MSILSKIYWMWSIHTQHGRRLRHHQCEDYIVRIYEKKDDEKMIECRHMKTGGYSEFNQMSSDRVTGNSDILQ